MFGSSFAFSSDNALELWKKIRDPIFNFNGDNEKFYSDLFGLLVNNLLPSKFADHCLTNTLMIEVAHGLVNHLNKNTVMPIIDDNTKTASQSLSEKELFSLQYVSGYVVKKLFTRFRYGRLSKNEIARTYATLLQSFKVTLDDSQKLINAKDRGGLWKVNRKILDVFIECELLFQQKTSVLQSSFHQPLFVKQFLKQATTISKFQTACLAAEIEVKKEIRLNLLEHMLSLYTNVRMFSLSKDIKEQHKMAKKESRKRSLRKEMKKKAEDH